MIYATATVPVNPEGEAPLTISEVWKGLVLKARDAREFLPPNLCTRCDVVEESATHIVREAMIGGVDLREIITFELSEKLLSFRPQVRAKGRSSTSCSRMHQEHFNSASMDTSACVARSPAARKSATPRRNTESRWPRSFATDP